MTPLQQKTAPHITDIIRRLQKAGYEAYVAGGAVRDFLLERAPKDYDVSCSATPAQIRKVFRNRRCFTIGRRFRLVHLYCGDDIVEISTFRKQPRPEEAEARPEEAGNAPEHMIFQDNEFGTAKDDAYRRDFTVNALFYNPVDDRLIDHTGYGVSDIRDRQVRCIGDPALRFEEDPVRMLRALKLVGQYGFTLEHATAEALKRSMPLIEHASPARLTLELEKILKNPYGERILRVFREYGFLRYFLPFLDSSFDTPQGVYLMRLLEKRNERLRAGLCGGGNLPFVCALFTLPFLEKEAGNPPGGLWDPAVPPGVSLEPPPGSLRKRTAKAFRKIMMQVFQPRIVTRAVGADALDLLLLQPALKGGPYKPGTIPSLFTYPDARNLALLQNEVSWHFPDPEEHFPPLPPQPGTEEHGPEKKRSRKRKHKYFSAAGHPQTPGAETPQIRKEETSA